MMNRGIEMPTIAAVESLGVTKAGTDHRDSSCDGAKTVVDAIRIPAISTAAGTASSLLHLATITQVPTTASPSSGNCAIASNGARHSGNVTPPSIALANGSGIAEIISPSRFHSPARTISTAVTRNAPTRPPQIRRRERSASPGTRRRASTIRR